MKKTRNWLASLAFAFATTVHAGQYSDLWFNPAESGWGVNVVQQAETAFVTLFAYGQDGKPVWYVAPSANIVAFASTGPIFSGTLYRTSGPWQGGVFNPAQVQAVVVGSLQLEVLALDRMRVHYSADGANNLVKEVVRQTWALPLAGANYMAQFILRESIPGQPPFGTHTYQAEVLVVVGEATAFVRTIDPLGRTCQYQGPYSQAGKLTRITGAFSCNIGDATSGTFEISNLEVTENGITGFLRTFAANNNASGRFGGARI